MGSIPLSAAVTVDEEIEISQQSISDIETGQRTVRDKELYALARVLDADPNWLFSWNEKEEKGNQNLKNN